MTEAIVRLAARGDGVTASGRFVAGAVPGDQVDAKGNITPGPNRQDPLCKHYGRCGGCQMQHVSASVYADFITARITSALAAHKIETTILTPDLSPPHTRRRASLRALRKGRQVTIGYAEAKSHNLVDLAECPVLVPELIAMIKPLRALLGSILPERRTANIRMTLADQGVDLLIEGVEIEGLAAAEALAAFAGQHKLARLSVDEGYGPSSRWEPEPVTVTLSGLPVALPEGAFLQATRDGEAALCAAVQQSIKGCESIVDLFAGIGTFTLATGAVHAAEGARDAILALQATVRAGGLATTTEHRDLFRRPLTRAELASFDGVVIDPPRAGAFEQIAELAASPVKHVAYVSCNPATFARDARMLLDGGFALEWVQPVGQFLWSTHVELAAKFSR
jgi:23S rRNA (uracil1939-C5)-methyltransferase